jgi:2-methylcitrate dehydratase PrpD
VKDRLSAVAQVVITTHESALRIIDKQGPLYNPADRDHCLQYMTAVALLTGNLTAADYEDAAAADPRIDTLRAKMRCVEESQYSQDYLDQNKRSIANAVQVFFADGSQSDRIEVEYPIGHSRRRTEGVPLLKEKFRRNVLGAFPAARADAIFAFCEDVAGLAQMPVHEFVGLFTFE